MRSSGILMHITSLPGPYGIGTLGKQAFAFVDFLKQAGQSAWQILPLTPTGIGDSPYQSCSAFAGSHYLIDLDLLVEEGLLHEEEVRTVRWCSNDSRVDFGMLYRNRQDVLRQAFRRFSGDLEFDRFCAENTDWLPDFALFTALKTRFGGKPWYDWPACCKLREPAALNRLRRDLAEEIRFCSFVQYQFDRQWRTLRSYAAEKGIRIIGDVPIYVPLDSVEVWKDPRLFQLDQTLTPTVVAGCPPDAFTEDGQYWGNPIYDWNKMEQEGFAWWIRRLAAAGRRYDCVRMDHFRALEAYWSIPYGSPTARGGSWVKGPGMAFISAVQAALPELDLIAEDLGYLTPEVVELRNSSGYPGMKVLEFAFDSREPSDYLPHTYTKHCIVYTGTHDNMTLRQWFETADLQAVAHAVAYMGLSESEGYVRGTIRTAMASVADQCIIPMADWLELGREGRMNLPGTVSTENWTWRAEKTMLTKSLAAEIRAITGRYGRLAGEKEKSTAETRR